MKLIDVNGYPHDLTPSQVRLMMAIGWMAFFSSWTMNILFYSVHPSAVDFSIERLREKCYIYILGRKYEYEHRFKCEELPNSSSNEKPLGHIEETNL